MMDSLKVQAIQAIADAHGGHITPEMVIEAARDKRHPLHSEFDWDVKSAAHKHWQNTARHIIRSVKIVYRVEHKNVTIKTGLSVQQSAVQVHIAPRSWLRYEAGDRPIPDGIVHLFCLLNKIDPQPYLK